MTDLLVGLMRMRGPITKTDVVAIRLTVRQLNCVLMELVEALGLVSGISSHSQDAEGADSLESTCPQKMIDRDLSKQQVSEFVS